MANYRRFPEGWHLPTGEPPRIRYHYQIPEEEPERPKQNYEHLWEEFRRAAREAAESTSTFQSQFNTGCLHWNTVRIEWPEGHGKDEWGCLECKAALEEDEYGYPRAIRR